MTTSLHPLLWPRKVAVVGASSDPRAPGGMLMRVLAQYGFGGQLHAVNPKGGQFPGGVRAVPRLEALPEVPDLCLSVVGAERTPEVLETCREIGIPTALVYASPTGGAPLGAPELGAGRPGLRVVGPNSVGFLNVAHRLAATWSPAIDLDRGGTRPVDGPVAIVAQSGGLGFGLLSEATRRGLGVRYVVSSGNEADVDALELARAVLDDPEVRCLLLFLEGLSVPADLVGLARDARDADVRLIVAKVGASEAGRHASLLHTAHLAGSDAAYEAVFEEYGVLRARDSEEMVDHALLCTRAPVMRGRSVGIATYSGGAGVWIADACDAAGLEVPALHTSSRAVLAERLSTLGSVRNPVDITGPGLSPTAMVDAAAHLAADAAVDAVVVITPMTDAGQEAGLAMDDATKVTDDLAEIQRGSGKPVTMFTYMGAPGRWPRTLATAGLAWYTSPTRLARSFAMLARLAERAARRPAIDGAALRAATPEEPTGFGGPDRVLLEYEVKEWLADRGVPTTRELMVGDVEAAGRAVAELGGGPVAMKAQVPGVVHKSAAGLVVLDVAGEQAAAVFARLWSDALALSGAAPAGVLVQEMVRGSVEFIVGTTSDPDFGPLIMVGTGGTDAELIDDRAVRLAPVSATEAASMLEGLLSYRKLAALGTGTDAARQELVDLVVRVSTLAWAHRRELSGLDLNPVMVSDEGVVVADASAEITVRAATGTQATAESEQRGGNQ